MKKKKSTKKCCDKSLKKRDKKCIREKDKKEFELPRKYSRKKCVKDKKTKSFSKKASCAPYKYCQKAGGSKEELEKILKSMSKEELISIILNSDIGLATVRPIETFTAMSRPIEPEPQYYKMPDKTDGSAFGFFDGNIYDKLYEGYIDDKYPNKDTCSQVKRLCDLDPRYCKEKKFQEKYHKLCKEIKQTLNMIKKILSINNKLERGNSNSSLSSSGSKDIYEIDEYIDLVNGNKYSGKKKFDDDVIDCLKEYIDEKYGDNRRERIYTTGGEDLSWSDLENILMDPFNENNLEDFMYEFGIKLHSKNPERYYPFIVEKIKQKILREYFM